MKTKFKEQKRKKTGRIQYERKKSTGCYDETSVQRGGQKRTGETGMRDASGHVKWGHLTQKSWSILEVLPISLSAGVTHRDHNEDLMEKDSSCLWTSQLSTC